MKALFTALALAAIAAPAAAEQLKYEIDPEHTFPSFAADHMGGLSVWRGKVNKTSGTALFDKATGEGSVDVTVDLTAIDFGQDELNQHIASPDNMDIAKYPTARYKGQFAAISNGKPARVEGALTFHGVTQPVALEVRSIKCMQHPVFPREVCGADLHGSFERDQFGFSAGKDYGFDMTVTLDIQVEALGPEQAKKP